MLLVAAGREEELSGSGSLVSSAVAAALVEAAEVATEVLLARLDASIGSPSVVLVGLLLDSALSDTVAVSRVCALDEALVWSAGIVPAVECAVCPSVVCVLEGKLCMEGVVDDTVASLTLNVTAAAEDAGAVEVMAALAPELRLAVVSATAEPVDVLDTGTDETVSNSSRSGVDANAPSADSVPVVLLAVWLVSVDSPVAVVALSDDSGLLVAELTGDDAVAGDEREAAQPEVAGSSVEGRLTVISVASSVT
jgi:hypothetical protein